MLQSETRQSGATAGTQADKQASIPGLMPAMAIAILSGLVCWFGLLSGGASTTEGGGEMVSSALAQVDDQDVTAALTTMSGSAAFLAQFKDRTKGCPLPLAWVSLVGAPGQPTGTVRLQSGSYFSPVFNVTDMPVRVAIPYPAPYEAGHGTLTALEAGGGALISLLPVWHVSAQAGGATHGVSWPVNSRCKQPNG